MNPTFKRYSLLALGGTALALSALTTTARPARAEPRPAMAWRGGVDDTTLVYFHAGDVRTHDVSGKGSRQTSSEIFDRLPHRPVRVFLTERSGRGEVRLVQQPTPENDFTAAVRISDPQSGRGHYRIALAWNAPIPPRGGGFGGERGFGGDRRFRGAVGGPYGGYGDRR